MCVRKYSLFFSWTATVRVISGHLATLTCGPVATGNPYTCINNGPNQLLFCWVATAMVIDDFTPN
jgi:hypothetical protein